MTSMTADTRWIHGAAAVAFIAVSAQNLPLNAQGLDNPDTVNAIVGSEIQEEQRDTAADAGTIMTAIDKTPDSISTVRRTSSLDKVDIVFLPDAAISEGGPPAEIKEKIKQHEADIAELRQEIEANALLFHAIDSRRVQPRDVIAVEFGDAKNVIIYATAKPAGGS